MTALTMERLATVLLNEGFVIKKIEDEQLSSFDKLPGEQYTGRIIIVARPVNEEEAEAEAAKLRKEKEKERRASSPGESENKGVAF